MQLTEIAFVLGEDWAEIVDEEGGHPVTRREFDQWDEFAAGVRRGLTEDIPVTVRESPPESFEGVLVVCEEPTIGEIAHRLGMDPARVYPYAFLLNTKRGVSAAERIDRLGVAGAILTMRYFTWRTERDDDFGSGVFGLRRVAETIGARCAESAYLVTERYCMIGAEERFGSLPELLAAYLIGYAQLLEKPHRG